MRKCLLPLTLAAALLLSLAACSGGYHKYVADYTGYFDVPSSLTGFARSQSEFDKAAKAVGELIENDGKLYDIYNDYDGINNIKTINDNAGIAPVQVDEAILDLLEFSVYAYSITDGTVNIAIGPVLSIWHDYRTEGIADPENAQIPPMDALREATEKTDINKLVIDRNAGTAFLTEKGMSLDVGAIAKGYTAGRAIEVAKSSGLVSALINMGGNIVSFGTPQDGRDRWAIGVQNPGIEGEDTDILDTVFVNDMALVSSGDYQRFYTVDGVRYNHIIDPQTLMPATRYSQVTVLHPDSGLADALSTAMFILPQDEGEALLNQNGAEGMWVYSDGKTETTPGFAAVSQKLGGYSAKD